MDKKPDHCTETARAPSDSNAAAAADVVVVVVTVSTVFSSPFSLLAGLIVGIRRMSQGLPPGNPLSAIRSVSVADIRLSSAAENPNRPANV